MSSENNSPPTVYTMRLDFDVRQVSTALRFNLLGNVGTDYTSVQPDGTPAIQKSGLAAGGYHLQQGDGINVAIYAYYDPAETSSITLEGLTLVSLPSPYIAYRKSSAQGRPDLSPCDPDYATCHFDAWEPNYPRWSDVKGTAAPILTSPKPFTTSRAFNTPPLILPPPGLTEDPSGAPDGSMRTGASWSNLNISATSGLWQIIGFLSVLVTDSAGGQIHRVYTFDPTVMVGNGISPP